MITKETNLTVHEMHHILKLIWKFAGLQDLLTSFEIIQTSKFCNEMNKAF